MTLTVVMNKIWKIYQSTHLPACAVGFSSDASFVRLHLAGGDNDSICQPKEREASKVPTSFRREANDVCRNLPLLPILNVLDFCRLLQKCSPTPVLGIKNHIDLLSWSSQIPICSPNISYHALLLLSAKLQIHLRTRSCCYNATRCYDSR